MEKMTLLEMTQNILSAMNSDEVNGIADTVESMMVAEEIRTTFRDIFTNHDDVIFEGLATLESPSNPATPNVLTLPANVQGLKWIKYKNYVQSDAPDVSYNDITYVEPEDFVRLIIEQPTPVTSVSVPILPSSSVTYPINNQKAPKYFTILHDDQTLVFDSFESAHESFLTGSNSLAWATQYKTFNLADDFIPPCSAADFPRLLAEAKSSCFINIKEIANSNEVARARRQKVASQRRRGTVAGQQRGALTHVDYSRKRR
jgi:hypothetical protein